MRWYRLGVRWGPSDCFSTTVLAGSAYFRITSFSTMYVKDLMNDFIHLYFIVNYFYVLSYFWLFKMIEKGKAFFFLKYRRSRRN